jgi:hypothetical protein
MIELPIFVDPIRNESTQAECNITAALAAKCVFIK